MKRLSSVYALFCRHRLRKQRIKRAPKVHSAFEIETQSGTNSGFGFSGPINDNGRNRYGDHVRVGSMFNQDIGQNRLNSLGLGNLQSSVANQNSFAALGLISHRTILLTIDENGQAYDAAGRKWSRA